LLILGVGSLRGRVGVGVESCKILFWGHFLFTCSETYAIGCNV